MKIAICYANFEKEQGKPLLSQNRQFQWYTGAFSYAVYPVVMAQAATVLKNIGHEVFWMDYIAEGKSYEEFVKDFLELKPDLAVFESKTPVIKKHWEIINFLKMKGREDPLDFARGRPARTKFVLCGDHVSAMPEESYKNSRVDYVLVGGNYDILLGELVRKIISGQAQGLPLQERAHHDAPLQKMPVIDRELTKWKLYAFNNGNYKYTPGAYTMAGRDCWWRRPSAMSNITNKQMSNQYQMTNDKSQIFRGCTFCSWTGIYPKWKVVEPERLLDEIEYLISLGVKEVFDDTGTFPVGAWLRKFCEGMIKRGYSKKIVLGCNMRAGVLTKNDYELMKRAGFRFILFGVESANNETLKKINKGVTVDQIEEALTMAKRVGMSPHATIMFGYPWESLEMAQNTVNFAKKLFRNNVIDSLQATIVIPYPGTALFNECKEKKLLRTMDWEKYDMRVPVMKCPISDERLKELVRECYSTVLTPRFLIRQIGQIRKIGDIKYLAFSGIKYLSKLGDFR